MSLPIKIQEKTKTKLDRMKRFPNETYDDVVKRLITQCNSSIEPLQNVDADWHTEVRPIELLQCPHCMYAKLSIYPRNLYGLLRNYVKFGEEEGLLKDVLIHFQSLGAIKKVDLHVLLKELYKRNGLSSPPTADQRFDKAWNGKDIDFMSLPDIQYSICNNCKKILAIDEWKILKQNRDVHTCPICNFQVEDDDENRTFEGGILVCPKLHYYFDRNWEIFNHLKREYPTIDHLRYDKRAHTIRIHPYEVESRYLLKLLTYAIQLDYAIKIIGASDYHNNALCIQLKRTLNI
jgi:hypothetical protein